MYLALRLREVLEKQVLVRQEAGEARLLEKDVMEVKVIHIPGDSTVVDVRKMGQLRLKGLKAGVCGKRCDYLVVTGEKEMDRAVFVELKKTLYDNLSGGMEQLRQSRPLLDYLHSVCRVHFGASSPETEITVRYCMIGEKVNTRFSKEPMRPRRPWRVETHRDIRVAAIVAKRLVRFDELWSGV